MSAVVDIGALKVKIVSKKFIFKFFGGSYEELQNKLIDASAITWARPTLITSQGSDTVTSIFKCNSSNTIKSLRLLKMA